jgi:hypothetical protein
MFFFSEIHSKHTNSMWSQCKIFESQNLWYVKLPVYFKKANIYSLCPRHQCQFSIQVTSPTLPVSLFNTINQISCSVCWSVASCLLGMRVRIPPEHGCLSLVNVVFCQTCEKGRPEDSYRVRYVSEIWYDMIWYMMWYILWYGLMWCGVVWCDVIWYDI